MPRSTSSSAATGDSVERRQRGEAGRRLVDGVAVRHPARLLARRAGQQPAGLAHGQLRAAELAHLGALDPAAERERRAPACRNRCRAPGCRARAAPGPAAARPSAYTDAGPPERIRPFGRAPAHLLDADVVRQQLGEHAALAHAARDQLRVLAAVVEDDDLVGRDARARAPSSSSGWSRRRSGTSSGRVAAGRTRPTSGARPWPTRRRRPSAARAHADRLVALELLALGLQRRRDHQLGPVELGDVLVAAGGHRGAQAAHQVERAVVLARGADDDLLERAVLRRLRRGRRAGSVGWNVAMPQWKPWPGRLVGAGERRADHHGVGAAGDRLGDVAAVAHAAVGDHLARTRPSRACAASGRPRRRRSRSPAGRRCRARRAWCTPRPGRRRRARRPRRCA